MPHPFYGTAQWKAIRIAAIRRDKWQCVMCGAKVFKKRAAHVDHKIPRKIAPQLALELSNLQTLCSKCHNSVKARDENRPDRGVNYLGFPEDGSWD